VRFASCTRPGLRGRLSVEPRPPRRHTPQHLLRRGPAAAHLDDLHLHLRPVGPDPGARRARALVVQHAARVLARDGAKQHTPGDAAGGHHRRLAALFALYTLLNPRVVAITAGYHGAHGVLAIFARLTGLRVVRLEDAEAQLAAGDVIHLETPLNPHGTARPIAHWAGVAQRTGATLVVDATLAPPPLQDPLALGARIVMHSGTKYFGGHSDLLLGTLSTREEGWLERLAEDRTYIGAVAGNMEAWLGVRSVRTLGLRVERQSASATLLVDWMEKARGEEGAVGKVVERVEHASLQAREEGGEWVREQMSGGWGPLFAITTRTEEQAKTLPSKLECFMHATSLGGVESLIEWRAMSDETCDTRLLRVSVGIESWEDLRDDLIRGFERLVEEGL
jgi:cystathionine gamma-synthase